MRDDSLLSRAATKQTSTPRVRRRPGAGRVPPKAKTRPKNMKAADIMSARPLM
jgi:hypothetical protein